MINRLNINKPVIVGGVGGSGTRVIADILIKLNYFLGSDFNESTDNLSFTFLFKRPHIYFRKHTHNKIFQKSITIFTNSMLDNKVFTIKNIALLLRLFKFNITKRHKQFHSNREALQRLTNILMPKNTYNSKYRGWGWKEPNSHIFVNELAEYFPNMKYIHVIRHGLDMAFSQNTKQLQNWHSLFDIQIPKEKSLIPVAQLEYWIKANERAIATAKQKLKTNFLLINFDELCENPKKQLIKMLEFLEIEQNNKLINQLENMPKIPKTKERYKLFDISIFSEIQIQKVKEFGFQI